MRVVETYLDCGILSAWIYVRSDHIYPLNKPNLMRFSYNELLGRTKDLKTPQRKICKLALGTCKLSHLLQPSTHQTLLCYCDKTLWPEATDRGKGLLWSQGDQSPSWRGGTAANGRLGGRAGSWSLLIDKREVEGGKWEWKDFNFQVCPQGHTSSPKTQQTAPPSGGQVFKCHRLLGERGNISQTTTIRKTELSLTCATSHKDGKNFKVPARV